MYDNFSKDSGVFILADLNTRYRDAVMKVAKKLEENGIKCVNFSTYFTDPILQEDYCVLDDQTIQKIVSRDREIMSECCDLVVSIMYPPDLHPLVKNMIENPGGKIQSICLYKGIYEDRSIDKIISAILSNFEGEKEMTDEEVQEKPKSRKVVTLIGDTDDLEEVMKIANNMTRAGYNVLLPSPIFRYDGDMVPFDIPHKDFIDISDVVFVMNKRDRSIDNTTYMEIDYAKGHGKEVEFFQPLEANVITICGSITFYEIMKKEYIRLTRLGNVVLLPTDCSDISPAIPKDILEVNHQMRISLSDYILVINYNGYIGKDTQNEIDFAMRRGIPVKYYEEVK